MNFKKEHKITLYNGPPLDFDLWSPRLNCKTSVCHKVLSAAKFQLFSSNWSFQSCRKQKAKTGCCILHQILPQNKQTIIESKPKILAKMLPTCSHIKSMLHRVSKKMLHLSIWINSKLVCMDSPCSITDTLIWLARGLTRFLL